MTQPDANVDLRRLAWATAAAAGVAVLVLVTAVLPAEYGLDLTGVGAAFGFTRLSGPPEGPAATIERQNDSSGVVYAFDARWAITRHAAYNASGESRELTTTRVPFTLNESNVTRVTARLEWVDDPASAPDEFEVSLDAPDGRRSQLVAAENGADGRGNVTSTLQWQSIRYPDPDHEGGVLLPRGTDDSAMGEWTAVVRLYGAGGFPSGEEDGANAWNLTIVVESFALETRVEAEGAVAWDTVTVRLRPNEDVEYKLHVDEGDAFRYEWESTLPVYVDFHAEPDVDPESFEQYRVDVLDEDAGTRTAAFTGRHGWYWKNDADEPVTITLRTRGDYEIVGVV